MKTILHLILALVIGVVVGFGLLTNVNFSLHDESQIANLHEYLTAFDYGQFPPRWSPDVHFAKGSPYLSFNYQLPYYFASVFHYLGLDLFTSYKLTLFLSFLIASFGAFVLCRQFLSPALSLVGALFYSTIPYHALDVYVRGTVGESFAIAFFPFVFSSLFRLAKKVSLSNILFFSLSLSCLILSHQPSTLLIIPVFFLTLIGVLTHQNQKSLLKSLSLATLLTLGLTAYYWIPVVAQKQLIQPVAPFNFYDHFPFLKQLIYSPWGFDSSVWGPDDGMSFRVGFAGILLLIIFVAKLVLDLYRRKIDKAALFLLLSAFLVLFLMNIRSTPIWEKFQLTSLIQFPWRLLSVFSLVLLLIYLYLATKLSKSTVVVFALVLSVVSLCLDLPVFHPGTITDHNDCYYLRRYLPNQCLHPSEYVSSDYLGYTEDYLPLPKGAIRQYANPSEKFITANHVPYEYQVNSPYSYLLSTNLPESTAFEFATFDYPGWVIYLNGQRIYHSVSSTGTIIFSVPKGTATIEIKFEQTPLGQLANSLSIITIISITTTFIWSKKLA